MNSLHSSRSRIPGSRHRRCSSRSRPLRLLARVSARRWMAPYHIDLMPARPYTERPLWVDSVEKLELRRRRIFRRSCTPAGITLPVRSHGSFGIQVASSSIASGPSNRESADASAALGFFDQCRKGSFSTESAESGRLESPPTRYSA